MVQYFGYSLFSMSIRLTIQTFYLIGRSNMNAGICFIREAPAAEHDEKSDSEDSEDQENVPKFTPLPEKYIDMEDIVELDNTLNIFEGETDTLSLRSR